MPQTSILDFSKQALPQGKSVLIVIDQREPKDFDAALEAMGAAVSRRQLESADFIVSERCGVERKSREDFESSIVDGRLFSQAAAMAENFERPVLVVEGIQKPEGGVSKEALLGAYACLVCDFGISVFFVKSSASLSKLLFSFARYEQVTKNVKHRVYARKKAVTMAQMQRAVVESFPGIGPQLAQNLLGHFGTVKNIMAASKQELESVPKLGAKKAAMLHNLLSAEFGD